jgi:hypothetical protein
MDRALERCMGRVRTIDQHERSRSAMFNPLSSGWTQTLKLSAGRNWIERIANFGSFLGEPSVAPKGMLACGKMPMVMDSPQDKPRARRRKPPSSYSCKNPFLGAKTLPWAISLRMVLYAPHLGRPGETAPLPTGRSVHNAKIATRIRKQIAKTN